MSNLQITKPFVFLNCIDKTNNKHIILFLATVPLFQLPLPISFDTCPCRFDCRRCPPETQPSNRHSYFKLFYKVYFMIKKILFALISSLLAINLACSNAVAPNSETNKAVLVNANPTDLPEGLSANQIPLSANSTPGIPDPKSVNANSSSNGAASTPGIPDTTKTGKTPMPKNTPRIPGIPDEETLKKQMNTPVDRSVMERKPPEFESNSTNRPNNKRKTVNNSKPNQ